MRLFGHPVHAMLVAFPLGLLLLLPLWDILAWSQAVPDAAAVAYWTQLAGLIIGLLAALTGVIDLLQVSDQARVLHAGLRHASFAAAGICIFGVAFAIRSRAGALTLSVVGLDFIGAACLAAAGWFGGHLVFQHRVGVAPAERSHER